MTGTTSARRWTVGLASCGSLMCALDALVVSSALTTIRHDLGASAASLQWTVNAYNLALAVLMIPAAALGDRFGRRRMFVLGLVMFVAASAACAVAPDVVVLSAARAVQGAGAALVTALSTALVGAAYPAERRGGAVGVLMGVTGVSVLAGPALGGVVTSTLGWEYIFWLNVPIGLVLVPLVLRKIAESRGPDTALDGAGVVLVTGATLAVMWALTRANDAGWTSFEVLAAWVAAAVLLVAFVRRQHRTAAPLLPLRLFRSRAFVAGNLATVGLYASVFGGCFFFPQFLQTTLGYPAALAGLALMPWTSTLLVLGPVSGRLSDRIGARPLAAGGLALTALGTATIALVARPGVPYVVLLVPLLVASAGASTAMPAIAAAVLGGVDADDVGKASGVNNTLRVLGGVLTLAVLVTVFSRTGGYATPGAFVAGFRATIGVEAGLIAAGAVAAAILPGRTRAGAGRPGRPADPDAVPAAGAGAR